MRYFFDTEFYEDGMRIHPISLGMISEDGRELYMEFIQDFKIPEGHWIEGNVLPHLEWKPEDRIVRNEGAYRILQFVGEDKNPQFWAYFADYDWVVFCQLFGTMMDLPKNFPNFCMDIQQWWVHLGCPSGKGVRPPKPRNVHNALADAKWNMEYFERLKL